MNNFNGTTYKLYATKESDEVLLALQDAASIAIAEYGVTGVSEGLFTQEQYDTTTAIDPTTGQSEYELALEKSYETADRNAAVSGTKEQWVGEYVRDLTKTSGNIDIEKILNIVDTSVYDLEQLGDNYGSGVTSDVVYDLNSDLDILKESSTN